MEEKLLNFISAHFTSFALQSKLDQGYHKGAFWPGDAVLLAGHHLLEDALQVPVGDVEAPLDQGLDWRRRGEGPLGELGVACQVAGELPVAGGDRYVPVDVVVAPTVVLANGVHHEVAVLGGGEVHVRQLGQAPFHGHVELPLGAVEVDVHLVVEQEDGAAPVVLSGDGGGEGPAVDQGLGGGEPLVHQGVLAHGHLLPVPLDLGLVLHPGDLQPGEAGRSVVDLDLKQGARLVNHVQVHIGHAGPELAENCWEGHVHLVRLLVC